VNTYVHLWQYLTELFLEWEQFRTKFAENYKTHILCSVQFFLKIVPFFRQWSKIWYSERFHTCQYMALAFCMLDNYGYNHTLRICNTYCFSTVTMIMHMRFSLSLWVHYITLHYITLHYITLHYITLHYITLHALQFHLSLSIRPIFSGILKHWLASLKIIST